MLRIPLWDRMNTMFTEADIAVCSDGRRWVKLLFLYRADRLLVISLGALEIG